MGVIEVEKETSPASSQTGDVVGEKETEPEGSFHDYLVRDSPYQHHSQCS